MELFKTEDYDEELGYMLFVSFSRDENGKILSEPPEVKLSHGYVEDDFDADKFTHFIDVNCNSIFEQADPVNFPPQ